MSDADNNDDNDGGGNGSRFVACCAEQLIWTKRKLYCVCVFCDDIGPIQI